MSARDVVTINRDEVEALIEVRGIYDGWSVAKMKNGAMVNRWSPGDYRYQPTQDWIDMHKPTPPAVSESVA